MRRLLYLIALLPSLAAASGITNPTAVPATLPTQLPLPGGDTSYISNTSTQESKTLNVTSGTIGNFNANSILFNSSGGIFDTRATLADVSVSTTLSTDVSVTFSTIPTHCYSGSVLCVTEGNGSGDPPRVMISTAQSYVHAGLHIDYPLNKPTIILDNSNINGFDSGIQLRQQNNGFSYFGGSGQWTGTYSQDYPAIGTYNGPFLFFTPSISTNPVVTIGSTTANNSMMTIMQPAGNQPNLVLDNNAANGSGIQFRGLNSAFLWVGSDGFWNATTSSDTAIGVYNNALRVYTNGSSTTRFRVSATSTTIATPAYIQGTTTNDSAPAGDYGEFISSCSFTRSPTTTGQYFDIASITLTPGDWSFSAQVTFIQNGATITVVEAGIGTVAGNNATGLSHDATVCDTLPPTSAAFTSCAMVGAQALLSSNQTYYLKSYFEFSAGSPQTQGCIRARRMR